MAPGFKHTWAIFTSCESKARLSRTILHDFDFIEAPGDVLVKIQMLLNCLFIQLLIHKCREVEPPLSSLARLFQGEIVIVKRTLNKVMGGSHRYWSSKRKENRPLDKSTKWIVVKYRFNNRHRLKQHF